MSEQETQPRQFGRYELISLIAVGGMGEIYLARSRGAHGFEKRLVIKKILPYLASEPEFVSKFVDEAKIVTELTHGNIVPVFDMGEIDGDYYIAMEFIAGRDLREVLKVCKAKAWQLPVKAAMFIMAEVCKGLDYAHHKKDGEGRDLNIIHRDISPSNILISTEGEVKLVDFGIAKATNKTTRSVTNQLQGKFCYMSPEQAMGKSLDKRSDLFSVGACLYELLTNTRPFEGRNDLDSLERVRTYEPPPPSALRDDIPEEVDAIVMRALGKSPADRFKDSDVMCRAILTWLFANGGVASREVSTVLLDVFPDGLEREETRGTSTLTPVQRLSIDDLMRVELDKMLTDEEGDAPTATASAEPTSHTPAAAPTSSSANSLSAIPARLDGKSETVSLIHPSAPRLTAVAEPKIRIGEEGIAPDEIDKIGRSVTAPLRPITAADRAALLAEQGEEPEFIETPRYGVETPVGLVVAGEEEEPEEAEAVAKSPPEPKVEEVAPESAAESRTELEPAASAKLAERPLVRRAVPLLLGVLLAGLAAVGYNAFFAPASLTVITVPQTATISIEGYGERYDGSGPKFKLGDLRKGEYTLKVSADGHTPEARTVVLGAGEREVLQFVLGATPAPPVLAETRSVKFETTPAGADIWVGGKPTGAATPGEVEIPTKGALVALIFKGQKKEIYIQADDTAEVYSHDFDAVAAVQPDAGSEADSGSGDSDASSTPPDKAETGRGTLVLASTPKGATVYINNKPLAAKTPTQTRLPVGSYSVLFKLKGYKPSAAKMARIKKSGERDFVSAKLEPEPRVEVPEAAQKVSVTLSASSGGSPVWSVFTVDGKRYNPSGMFLVLPLTVGPHSISAKAQSGSMTGSRKVQVKEGTTTIVIPLKSNSN